MQEVNLLSEDLKPHNDPFTLREFAVAWGVLVVLLTGLTGWEAYGVWQIEQDLRGEQQRHLQSSQELATLQATARKQADPALVQQLSNLVNQRDEQRQLAVALETEPLNAGFRGHLSDLARIDMRNLWFDSIALTEGGRQIHLSGFSSTAERVPLFLSMLSDGESFSGYRFDGLQIKRETDSLVSFEVHGPLAGMKL